MLPNSKGFIDIGRGEMVHDMNGFELTGAYDGTQYKLTIPAQSVYSCHIEYEYGKYRRDCVDLNTLKDSFWVFPRGDNFSVTKISLATEELFNYRKP